MTREAVIHRSDRGHTIAREWSVSADASCVGPSRSNASGCGATADCAGHIALELKRVWHDGTRELVFEPLEFLERLAAPTPTAGKEPADLPRLTGPARPLALTARRPRLAPRA